MIKINKTGKVMILKDGIVTLVPATFVGADRARGYWAIPQGETEPRRFDLDFIILD